MLNNRDYFDVPQYNRWSDRQIRVDVKVGVNDVDIPRGITIKNLKVYVPSDFSGSETITITGTSEPAFITITSDPSIPTPTPTPLPTPTPTPLPTPTPIPTITPTPIPTPILCPTPKYSDNDDDGVEDSKDAHPNDATQWQENIVDTDGDGVIDLLDKCAYAVEGSVVDSDG